MLTKNIVIENSEEVEQWLYHRAVILNHRCDGIKGRIDGDLVNIAYRDVVTKESIQLKFKREQKC